MKVAIVHDWIVSFGGAEKVVLKLHDMFPNAPIYTLVYNKKMDKYFKNIEIHTSFIQKMPFGISQYRKYLPLMPLAFEQFDLSQYDLVISSSSCCAKGINVNSNTLHICYCHTPMRYAWDMYSEYNNGNIFKKSFIAQQIHKLRQWDYISSNRVDYFIANSNYVAKRINKHYRRKAKVIYPPISNCFFNANMKEYSDNGFYLLVTRLVPYKKVDLIIKTFNKLKIPLIIVGEGPEKKKLKKIANENISFRENISNELLVEYYKNCKAFVFAAEEDFGMVMAEAQAVGKPVIAYYKGGASEIISNGKTGILFENQSQEDLEKAILKLERTYENFKTTEIRKYADKFNEDEFEIQVKNFVEEKLISEGYLYEKVFNNNTYNKQKRKIK